MFLLFVYFLTDSRTPSQSSVVPAAPLLCSETLGCKMRGGPQRCVNTRDYEDSGGGYSASYGNSRSCQEPTGSCGSYFLYLSSHIWVSPCYVTFLRHSQGLLVTATNIFTLQRKKLLQVKVLYVTQSHAQYQACSKEVKHNNLNRSGTQ